MKKIITIVISIICAVGLVGPGAVNALTADELQTQINALLAQLTALQTQLGTLQGTTPTGTTVCTITSFTSNLAQGSTGDAVKCLQVVLNTSADTQVATTGAGSPGNETSYFGPLTKAAAVKFQVKYAADILTPLGLTAGTGFVGSSTRAKLNTMLSGVPTTPVTTLPEGCTSTTGYSPLTGVSCATGATTPVTPPAAGALTVTLAADTPAAASLAAGANSNFTKVIFTAGGTAVSMSQMYITRSGLTANADLENLKVVDMAGVNVGSVGSLNTNGQALITFIPAITVPANTSVSYYIRAGFISTITAGKTATLGINAASDVSAGGSTVGGTFPIAGNSMTAVSIAIGSAQVTNDGAVTDSAPNVGATDVIVNQFKVTAGSTEAITIEQVTVMEAGTASLSDTANIELYSVTEGKSLGTVANWSGDGKASWSGLNLVIDRGNTYRFKIMVDVINGSGLTVNVDLTDGGDVLLTVKGNTYGFYITPTVTGSWTGKGGSGATVTNQTIAAGALTVSKAVATPPVGNIAQADNQSLTTFAFDVRGESVKITSLKFAFDLTDMVESEITNVRLFDENGALVAGPQDLNTTDYAPITTTYEGTVTFTDTIIVPTGIHNYTVKAKIASTTTAGDKIICGIADADADITARGMQTNDTITAAPSASEVNGNQQTVKAGALTATTLTQPAARNIAKGIQNFIFATASLNASNSGEDVLVTALIAADAVTGTSTGTFADIDNLAIWADLTSDNSARGDVYETKVSNTEQPTGTTKSINLTQTIRVLKNSIVKLAVVADLSTGATTDDIHTINLSTAANSVTATGADTGATVACTPTGAGQGMTVKTGGTLTVTVDASSPTAALVMGGAQKSTLGIFRLTANSVENQDLDSIIITDEAGTGGKDLVSTYYFYSSKRSDGGSTSDPIATAPGGATATVFITDGAVTISADSYVLITVKGDLNLVDGSQVVNADTIKVTVNAAGDIDATGLASGSAIASVSTNVDAAEHVLYKSRPYFSVNASSPSGSLIPGANTLLAIFDIKADAGEDIFFDGGTNQVIFNVSVSKFDDDNVSETWTVKDQDGNTLDTATAASALTDATSITCDFGSNDLTIPAGETKRIYFYGTTTDLETAGDAIQIWLDDAANANLEFGIATAGDYAEGIKIFKGDIFAGALVKP